MKIISSTTTQYETIGISSDLSDELLWTYQVVVNTHIIMDLNSLINYKMRDEDDFDLAITQDEARKVLEHIQASSLSYFKLVIEGDIDNE